MCLPVREATEHGLEGALGTHALGGLEVHGPGVYSRVPGGVATVSVLATCDWLKRFIKTVK